MSKAGAEACPHIICGDFNSEPFSPGYLMAKDGYLSDEGTINRLQQLQNLQFPDGRVGRFSLLCMQNSLENKFAVLDFWSDFLIRII